MPPVTLSAISSSATKVRWKEPYASEGLNRKVAVVIPAGVYRGLILGVSTSNLSVDLSPDASAGDHVAVQESSTGFSMTYVDDTSGTITLPLTGFLANDVVVICLVVNYSSGSSTTAEFRGYELSEFEALTADVRDSFVVLGTVLRPAAGIIPAGNITHDRRHLPFLQRTSEATPWNPLLRNGGFELGQTNGTYRYASPFWKTSSSNANFTIRPVTTEARSGSKSLEMTTSVAGVVTATIQQDLWIPVTPGRFAMGRLYKKAIQAAGVSPTGRMRFLFGDMDGTNDVQEDLLFDISGIDTAFEESTGIIEVPSTARVLKAIQIIITGTYAGVGPCIRLDDVQAWLQVDAGNWLDVRDARVAEAAAGDMFIGAQNSFGNNSAKLSFDGTALSIERRDETISATTQPPVLSVRTRGFLETGSNRYTLVFQSEIPITGGSVYYRKYVGALAPALVETLNASWSHGSLQWSKDVAGIPATRYDVAYSGTSVKTRISDTAWSDGSWVQQLASSPANAPTTANSDVASVDNLNFAPLIQARDFAGNSRTIVDHNGYIISRVSEIRQEWLHSSAPQGWTESVVSGGTVNYDAFGHGLRMDVPNTVNAYAGIHTQRQDLVLQGSQFINVMEWDNSLGNAAAFDQCNVFMGWGQNVQGGNADLFIHIGKDSAGANWKLFTHPYTGGSVNYISGATATVDTGVAANGLATRFRLEWYGSGAAGGARVLAYINGQLKAQVLTGGSLPVSSMGIAFEIKRITATGSNKNIQPGPFVLKHNRFLSDDVL
jgi:hypothetical protein